MLQTRLPQRDRNVVSGALCGANGTLARVAPGSGLGYSLTPLCTSLYSGYSRLQIAPGDLEAPSALAPQPAPRHDEKGGCEALTKTTFQTALRSPTRASVDWPDREHGSLLHAPLRR